MTPIALVIRYKIMLMLLTKIQNIRKMTCFGVQSSELSFECIICDITKECTDGGNHLIGSMAGYQKRGLYFE